MMLLAICTYMTGRVSNYYSPCSLFGLTCGKTQLTLYSDKELWFDFGQRKRLTKAGFRKSFGHLQFNSALQYVALPQVEFEEDEQSSTSGTRARSRKVSSIPGMGTSKLTTIELTPVGHGLHFWMAQR